jgi:hypothetical protein
VTAPSAPAGSERPGQDSEILAGIEQRVVDQVAARLSDITNHFGAYLGSVIREQAPLTGTELVSRHDVHNTLTTILNGAQARIETTVRAGYKAGGSAARKSAAEDLPGHSLPPPPEDDPYLTGLISALTIAFAAALLDILDSVRDAYDSVVGIAAAVVAARVLATHRTLDRAVRRLGVRARSTATVAVHRGYTNSQTAAYASYQQAHPALPIRKQWTVTSTNPCPTCRALHGVTIGIDEQFDGQAGATTTYRPPRVWRDLAGPPRHPHCRCRLVYIPTAAAARVLTRLRTPPPVGTPTRISAADVRTMPRQKFAVLVAFFRTAANRIRALLNRRRPAR